ACALLVASGLGATFVSGDAELPRIGAGSGSLLLVHAAAQQANTITNRCNERRMVGELMPMAVATQKETPSTDSPAAQLGQRLGRWPDCPTLKLAARGWPGARNSV